MTPMFEVLWLVAFEGWGVSDIGSVLASSKRAI